MNPKKCASLILALSVVLTGAPATAEEWGLSGTIGTGNFDLTSKPYLLPRTEASGTMKRAGAALVMVSDPFAESWMAARFSLGFEKVALDSGGFTRGESYTIFSADVALKILLGVQPAFRFWLGPELRLGLVNGSGGEFTRNASSDVVGLGAMLGADLYPGEQFGVSLAAGARAEKYTSRSQYPETRIIKGGARYVFFMTTLMVNFDERGEKSRAGADE